VSIKYLRHDHGEGTYPATQAAFSLGAKVPSPSKPHYVAGMDRATRNLPKLCGLEWVGYVAPGDIQIRALH